MPELSLKTKTGCTCHPSESTYPLPLIDAIHQCHGQLKAAMASNFAAPSTRHDRMTAARSTLHDVAARLGIDIDDLPRETTTTTKGQIAKACKYLDLALYAHDLGFHGHDVGQPLSGAVCAVEWADRWAGAEQRNSAKTDPSHLPYADRNGVLLARNDIG